jgi:hypothetical protein
MPWVRIDENAMDHPKFLVLTDGAWRLWCEAQAYCQKHLTDGVIPMSALRGFRYYSPSRMKNLLQEAVPGKGPCWHLASDGSILVHDYLDWNDSREEVLKAREMGKERRRRYQANHAYGNASCNASSDTDETANVSCGVGTRGSSQPVLVKREGGSGETTAERIADFMDYYREKHAQYIGVPYMGHPQNDYHATRRMVETFTDQQMRDAAIVWFGMSDEFAKQGTRTVPKFASRITACLQLIKEKGIA